jgi:hypothetical protein
MYTMFPGKKISAARKKKKKKEESVWRDPCTISCLVVAVAYVLLLLLALTGPVEAATELVHAYGGTVQDIGRV